MNSFNNTELCFNKHYLLPPGGYKELPTRPRDGMSWSYFTVSLTSCGVEKLKKKKNFYKENQ